MGHVVCRGHGSSRRSPCDRFNGATDYDVIGSALCFDSQHHASEHLVELQHAGDSAAGDDTANSAAAPAASADYDTTDDDADDLAARCDDNNVTGWGRSWFLTLLS